MVSFAFLNMFVEENKGHCIDIIMEMPCNSYIKYSRKIIDDSNLEY